MSAFHKKTDWRQPSSFISLFTLMLLFRGLVNQYFATLIEHLRKTTVPKNQSGIRKEHKNVRLPCSGAHLIRTSASTTLSPLFLIFQLFRPLLHRLISFLQVCRRLCEDSGIESYKHRLNADCFAVKNRDFLGSFFESFGTDWPSSKMSWCTHFLPKGAKLQ